MIFIIPNLLPLKKPTPLKKNTSKCTCNSMTVHSTTIFFFFTSAVNYSSDLNSHVYWVDCLLPYNKHCNTSIYLLTSIFESLASEIIIKLHSTVLQLPPWFIIFTCFSLADAVCSAIWNAYCGLLNTSPKPGETRYIIESDGHIKNSIRH